MKQTSFIFFLLLLPLISLTQGSHYWTQGFGAKSTFVSGANIADVNDNSAIFYNPAGIGNLASTTLSINANVYGLSYINIMDGLGEDRNLSGAKALLYPQLLSGSLKLKSKKWNVVGAYLSRHYAKSRIPLFDTQVDDYVPNIPGKEAYNINLDIEDFLHEQWAGLGVGYKYSNKLFFGLSAFISYRNQRTQTLYSRSIIPISGIINEPIGITITQRTVIDLVALQLKAGAQYITDNWKLGATLTVPKIKLFAFGNGRFEELISNVEPYSATLRDGVALEQSSTYSTAHRTPWSLALGATYRKEKNTWHITVEGFAGVAPYEIAKPKNPNTLITPITKRLRYMELLEKGSLLVAESSSRPILNVAIGLDRALDESMSIHYGFRTDFNYYNGDFNNNVNFDSDLWDLYHFTIGLSRTKEKVTATVGMDNAIGYRPNLPSFGNANIPTPESAEPVSSTATAFTYVGSIVIGVAKAF